jgi:alpha-L-arabinofuranosidase
MRLLQLMAAMLLPVQLLAQETRQIFVYSPNERAGLHIAVQTGDTWQEAGQLCSSDYGTWGVEKRMIHPSVCRAQDGTWRLVFQVNDRAPLFAAAYSRDLVNWRPQDYPIMSTTKCLEPVVFTNQDGTFDIYYKSPEGKRWTSATPNFRDFTPDRASQISDDAWLRDTATIGNKLYEGNSFEIAQQDWLVIENHFKQSAEDARKSNERMHDDPKNPILPTSPIKATLTVDLGKQKPISDKLIGIFFEDISYAADGGLYAELIQNRDFEYNAKDRREWTATTAWHSARPIEIATEHPLSPNNPHYAILWPDTLWNEGWDGIAVEKGKKYDFSMYVLAGGQKQDFLIQLVGQDGTVLAKSKLKTKSSDWTQYATVLTAKASDAKARLAIVPLKAAHVGVDMISLFPQETFMNRKNGLRKDLAQVIADLKPKFVRFPGGCMSHGQGLENIYHWNHTVGPLQDRKPDFNIWGYHQTRGLGFFEYFQFCEDIGAEPLPVLAAGVPCQNSAANARGIGGQQGGIPMDDMPAYVQELLDLIDWANGDPATSKWAKMRADAGHPAPFNLKYIGIGNEDIISTVFEERFTMIARAIRAKYPDIKICGTVGPFHTPSADYQEGWDFTRRNPDLQYMVDEHYYESTGWFMHHRDYYDRYPREAPLSPPEGGTIVSASKTKEAPSGAVGGAPTKVYLGEWAASTNVKRPNVETALAEALYLTDIERNGDIVEMTSYAPMLCKDSHSNWNPDMIYFSNTDVRTTPAYDVQRLFSVYGGDMYVNAQFTMNDAQLAAQWSHRIGASVVKDSKTGKTYVKLVNALPVSLELTVNGLDILATAKTEGFQGKPEEQRLTLTTGEVGSQLTLPPYSMKTIEL